MSRAAWTWDRALAIAVGGSLGAATRWCTVELAGTTHRFPWPVLAVNLVGSFLLGVLLAEEPGHPRLRLALHDVGAIGFCGGLTTFSTFTVEVADLVDHGEARLAALYGASSVAGTIAAVLAGAALLRGVRAIRLPLEEEP